MSLEMAPIAFTLTGFGSQALTQSRFLRLPGRRAYQNADASIPMQVFQPVIIPQFQA